MPVSAVTRSLPVRGLVEGAVLASLVTVLAVAARAFPLIGFGASLLCPVPLTVLTIRHGVRVAAMATVVATILGSAIAGPLVGAIILLTYAPVGFALGMGIRARMTASKLVAATAVAIVAALVVSSVVATLGLGIDPRTIAQQTIAMSRAAFDASVERLLSHGADRAQVEAQGVAIRAVYDLLARAIPLVLALGSVIAAYLHFEVSRAILRRVGYPVPALPPMSMWGLPPVALWVLPLASLGLLAAGRSPALEAIALSLGLLLVWMLLGQGILAGWVLMTRYRFPSWYRVIVLVLFLSSPAGLVVFLLGAADVVFDLRRRWRSTMEFRAPELQR